MPIHGGCVHKCSYLSCFCTRVAGNTQNTMTDVTVNHDQLLVTIHGMDVLWAFKSHIMLPLEHVVGARRDPHLRSEGPWLGAGRTSALLGYAVAAGPMMVHGRREFWDVHDPDRAVSIDLLGERYQRLVIEVADPEAVIDAVNAAARAGRAVTT
jgi:hypothetical protein